MNRFLVSVFMLTYNQEEFISNTIESVLMQKTDFDYQLVIGEDASTDRTAEICRGYQKEYGEKIKLLSHDRNIGLIRNFIETYKECDGRYVAILDGDDYWTDPYKLQKQADFLQRNSDYSIVFTSFKKLFPDGRFISKDYSNMPLTTGFEVMVKKNYICSATVMFKNKLNLKDYPDWLGRFPYGDWPLYLWSTRNGEKIGFLKEETAVYRMEIGVSEKLKNIHSDIVKVNLQILKSVEHDPNFNSYRKKIKRSLLDHKNELMAAYLRERKTVRYFKAFLDLFSNQPLRALQTSAYILKRSFLN